MDHLVVTADGRFLCVRVTGRVVICGPDDLTVLREITLAGDGGCGGITCVLRSLGERAMAAGFRQRSDLREVEVFGPCVVASRPPW